MDIPKVDQTRLMDRHYILPGGCIQFVNDKSFENYHLKLPAHIPVKQENIKLVKV